MSEKFYTEEHEWLSVDDGVATVGVSVHAAEQLGDVVYVELPEVGASFEAKADMAVVESVKAASDVYAPVAGEVVAVNDALTETPAKVNEDAEGEGWFVKLRLADPGAVAALMNADAYKTFLDSE